MAADMAPAIASTVVGRPAAQVFAYATDPARFRQSRGPAAQHCVPAPRQGRMMYYRLRDEHARMLLDLTLSRR
jgi:hypothetical protein